MREPPANWTCHFFKGAYAQEGARFACFNSMPSAVWIRADSRANLFGPDFRNARLKPVRQRRCRDELDKAVGAEGGDEVGFQLQAAVIPGSAPRGIQGA